MKLIQRAVLLALFAAGSALLSTAGSVAQVEGREPGPLVGIGEDIWRAGPACWNCHGNMANGHQEDPRSPQGANLRESLMDVELLKTVIRCGLPGTQMPYFGGRNAYVGANSCYGTTAEVLGNQMPPEGAQSFNTRQIDALAQFLFYQFVGMGPATKEECLAFYGPTASSCNRWPTAAEVAAGAGG